MNSFCAPGLLHVGDIIVEINGQEVTDPDQLQEMMKKSSGSVTFKILPSCYDNQQAQQVCITRLQSINGMTFSEKIYNLHLISFLTTEFLLEDNNHVHFIHVQ